ncbi:Glycylpeptide N-tetradecanoyltransferase 1 [Symbiodinium microadriaticum]|uniref:Glycylpeptide N-tetradecanoyltransferase n=1 Tax=Symbiodinium microadriaticum TaxID=2951 RepID=A0A1Q9EVS6_SYMMI|nr:Glycylpeptide N-tetradecanoyltransferase 1 [Symbiodinium microadriaticum]
MTASEKSETKELEAEEEEEEEEVDQEAKDEKKTKQAGKKDGYPSADANDGEEGETQTDSQTQLLQMLRKRGPCEESRRHTAREHPFWDTQPVPSMSSEYDQDAGPLDELKTVDDVRPEPYPLPGQFEWCTCNVDDDAEMQEVYSLLTENYVEDDDSMFRFDYSIHFLRWALKPPEFLRNWHLGVRVKGGGKLVGFITGIPAKMRVYDKSIPMVEINFLCVHKKLRSKRLAPVLIKEITRRVNRENVWQAVYTAGVVLPRPVSQCRYWHRSLNPKKLIEVGFSHLGQRMTMARTIKLYKVPDTPQLAGMREMRKEDVPRVHGLVSNYLQKFSLHPEFTPDEVEHWMLPKEGVVSCWVRENEKGEDLMLDALSVAKQQAHAPVEKMFPGESGFDVFNALDIMDNESFLKDLKFGIGDGYLRPGTCRQYYLYNWKCPKIEPRKSPWAQGYLAVIVDSLSFMRWKAMKAATLVAWVLPLFLAKHVGTSGLPDQDYDADDFLEDGGSSVLFARAQQRTCSALHSGRAAKPPFG